MATMTISHAATIAITHNNCHYDLSNYSYSHWHYWCRYCLMDQEMVDIHPRMCY